MPEALALIAYAQWLESMGFQIAPLCPSLTGVP